MRVSRHRFVQAVAGTISRHALIAPGSRLLAAVSGGADSVALASVLRELSGGRRSGFELTLAHLNHNLRPTARRDQQFVTDLAARWGLPLVVEEARVAEVAKTEGLGLEEAARQVRYEFLDLAARTAGAAAVATGHQRDDQAETVLMSFLRGAGVRGLAGMPIRRPIAAGSSVLLVRPLLEVDRAALADYLRDRRLEWVEDETNLSLEMRRNRVRHELLPLLERDYAPGLRRRLAAMADQVAAVQGLLAARAAGAWDGAVRSATARGVEFDLECLRREGRAVTSELLLAGLEQLGAGRGRLTAEHLAAAWELVTQPRGSGRLELPGATLERRRGRLRLGAGPAGFSADGGGSF